MRLALEAFVKSRNPLVWDLSRSRAAGLPGFYRRLLRSHDAVAVVAEALPGEEVVGMAIGRLQRHPQFEPGRSGKIDDVWVDPRYRRRSVARRMMIQVARHFRQRGIRMLLLEYAIGNRGAEKAWPRLGFSPVFIGATADVGSVLRRRPAKRSET
jgi:ribosomal protein S18 acetylase RimI-like enzyme